MMKLFWVLAVLPLAVHAAQADIITIDTKTQSFNNTDCAKNASCDLKDFVVRQENYKVTIPSHNITAYGTRMFAVYNTSSMDALENFGLVQFVKGCQWESQLVNGQVVNSRDVEIEHYGKVVPFYFPQEVIDGFVADPIDWGDQEGMPTRFFFYLNKYIGSNEPQQNDYYGIQKPTIPRLYLRDMPGQAQYFAEDGTARNISNQFRLCVYKTADVPKVVADSDVNFATPIQCFNWNSSFVYNFATKQFDRPADIVDFCK